jgi:hypothetical protein
MLLDWMRHAQAYGKEANGLILRKELIQLKDLIKESIRVYTPLGWRWRESPKTWTTPGRLEHGPASASRQRWASDALHHAELR